MPPAAEVIFIRNNQTNNPTMNTTTNHLRTKQLGRSDLFITSIGFGSWAVGGPWAHGWSTQDDGDSIAAIHRALELGINWIDTAAIYGLGHSEEIVAKALTQWKGNRPYVFTKCGMVWDKDGKVDYSVKPASLRREIESSLRRLKVETIDLYQIHWPVDEMTQTEEGWAELAKFQKEGKVRWIGVSNFGAEELRHAQAIAPVTSLQPPYSLIRRDIEEEVFPLCESENIGVIAYSPMASGLLTGAMTRERAAKLPADDWRRGNVEFQEPKLSKNLQLVERLRKVGARRGLTPGQVAIAWTLRHPAVTGAIVGARNAKQVEQMMGSPDFRLSVAEIYEVEGAKTVAA
jgi:aryl-alcohol dehydrogenase-like predicted oxidoreductase